MLITQIYFEPREEVSSMSKVEVFGNFTKTPWSEKIPMKYDSAFKSFKTAKVKIMIGQQFKFVVNGAEY